MTFMRKLIVRFCAKSPFVFTVLNWLCNIAVAVGLIQDLLLAVAVTIPEPYNFFANKTFLVCAGVVRLLSGLTVDKNHTIKNFTEE